MESKGGFQKHLNYVSVISEGGLLWTLHLTLLLDPISLPLESEDFGIIGNLE